MRAGPGFVTGTDMAGTPSIGCGRTRQGTVGKMTTKLPMNDNQVVGCERRPGRRGERGIALISVIAVLVLLAMIATPFLLTMTQSKERGDRFLYTGRADAEAQALFETVRSELIGGIECVERRKLDDLGPGAVSAGQDPPADATPTYDTPAEMTMSAATLARFNRATAKEHRVWAADIVDSQTLFNLNNCSYGVLANILGHTEVTAATTSDKTSIPLLRVPESFPKQDGIVRISGECVKYKRIVGNELVDCERGYMASVRGNGPAHDIELAEPVILEACYQIATRPFRLRQGTWVRYTNIDQARTISDLGVAALLPQDFERLRPYVTAWNGNAVGDGWCNPQLVRNGITAADNTNLYVKLKNVRYFGPGTMVRITDGVNEDYGVVSKIRGTDEVLLAGQIAHDYAADQARIYCLARAPINVNTADVATLALCFTGLHMRGKSTTISDRQAESLAIHLKNWTRVVPPGTTPAVKPQPGVFRNWEDFTKALEDAQTAGTIDDDACQAVLLNAMNANDSQLGFSTVPFVFRSFDMYEVRAIVSIQGAGGREMARRELRRVMEVSATRSGTFVIETQDDFQDQIIKSRDAKYMATYPDNVDASYDGKNIPASEYKAFRQRSNFPSTARDSGIGDVQLLPAASRMGDGNRKDYINHFDEERIPDGFEIAKSPYTISVDTPYDPVKGKSLDLVDVVTIDGHGSDIELGLKEFAVSFWYRPEWERDNSQHIIFDYGLDNDHMDRVSLRYEPAPLNALVLACNGATREQRSSMVIYRFDHTTWTAKEWYHIACHVHGSAPGMSELWVDGEKQGAPYGLTRLTGTVPATGGGMGQTINVEDARDFPDTGVLLVYGKDGIELMEYNRKTQDSFTIQRRKARSVVNDLTDSVPRSHVEGDIVQLYGFTGPLLTDLKKGGGTLDAAIGPWRAYRMLYEGDILVDTNSNRIAYGLGTPPSGTTAAVVTIPLAEWDSGSTDPGILDDLGPAGTFGIGMIASYNQGYAAGGPALSCDSTSLQQAVRGVAQSNTRIGGVDIVVYQVSQSVQGAVDILARGLTLKHAQANVYDQGPPRFFPKHEYGDQSPHYNPPDFSGGSVAGSLTAFIPIAVLAQATNADYLDPADKEPQLRTQLCIRNDRDPLLRDGHAYAQIDGEWFAYDTYDPDISTAASALAGKVAFYRDLRLDDFAASIGAFEATNLVITAPTVQASAGQGGGSGGNSSNDEPPVAQELNPEGTYPPVPVNSGGTNGVQPRLGNTDLTTKYLADRFDFRGYVNSNTQEQHRIANTIPAEHAGAVPILPAFLLTTGNCLETTFTQNDGAVFAYPGFNDLITLRDVNGNDEQVRVQWGYMGWCALTAVTNQTWLWDRPQGGDGNAAMRRWDSRAWTSALKFPCGEMADGAATKASQNILFGKKYDNTGSVSGATIDELYFPQFKRAPKNRPDYTFLGIVPPEVADANLAAQQQQSGTPVNPPVFTGITDDKTTEFHVHMPVLDASGQVLDTDGIPIHVDTYSTDGGVVLIDDELIMYDEFDPETGRFSGCIRGAFNTDPHPHGYEARVIGVQSFPTTRLTSPIDTSTASYELEDTSDFPDDGYLRVGLSSEIIGYTNWDVRHLSAPLGRFDPTQDNTTRDPNKEKKKVAGSIFRGRFGTIPQAADAGAIAIAMPFRVYDRYAERADDPEQSYLQLSWTKHGAIWKRITWDEDPRKFINVIALVRFSGGPPWDSSKIVRVGQEQMPVDDRRQYLYQIDDPTAINLLNVEADRIEVRIGMRYEEGAYNRLAPDIAPDSWKETPAIRKVTVEYVAPPQVLTQE